MNKQYVILVLMLLVMLLSATGCEDKVAAQKQEATLMVKAQKTALTNKQIAESDNTEDKFKERTRARTWSEIKASGVINAVKLKWPIESALPRAETIDAYHSLLLKDFADERGLAINWLRVDNLAEMFDLLSSFKVDIIPRRLTITHNRTSDFSFTYPLLRDKEVVIAKKSQQTFDPEDNNVVHLPLGSAYIESVKKQFPHWKIEIFNSNVSSSAVSEQITEDKFKYSIIDNSALETLQQYRTDIHNVFTLPKTISLAWAVNLNNTSFLYELNEFISVHHVMKMSVPDRTIDFEKIKKDKLPLRVITRNSPETYFLWRGELLGFEYELMKKFADIHQVKLVTVVANSYDEMLQLLKEGKGDIIAAGLSRTTERTQKISEANLTSSIRYNRVKEQLVAHAQAAQIKSLTDLKGRTITLRKTSSFWTIGQKLSKEYGAIILAADEKIPTEVLIEQVADRTIDLTIADSNLINIERTFLPNIITPLTFKENVPYAYILRKENAQLLSYINEFIRKHYRGTFYNVLKNKYFYNEASQHRLEKGRLVSGSILSPYDDLVRVHVQPYNFDWRLIVSQMYQESRFDPLATNSTGALGLMQMLPRTAQELGVKDLADPEQAIASGILYLDWTRDRFSQDLPIHEQIFFSLASYNAGFGHVKDAQRLAKQLGLRNDKWFNNVEQAMLLLQRRHYYKNARFGYVRGREPVNYVRDIHQRYLSYIRITE